MDTLIPVTSLYVALLAIYFVVISVRVSLARNQTKISLGDGNNQFLFRRIRVHGNFAEYIPFVLILFASSEIAGLSGIWLHLIGVMLVFGHFALLYGLEYSSLPG